MSKSVGNTIEVLAEPDVIRKQVMSMVTDTKRILRTDPGRPEVCNVCQLHRFFGPDYEEIWDGERTARTGCVDTKRLLADRIIAHYAPARERYLELSPIRTASRARLRRARTGCGRSPKRRWTTFGGEWGCAERREARGDRGGLPWRRRRQDRPLSASGRRRVRCARR